MLQIKGDNMAMGRDNKKRTRPLCKCGCGRQVKKFSAQFLPGHHRKLMTGDKNPFYGKTHSEFAKQCITAYRLRHNNNIE